MKQFIPIYTETTIAKEDLDQYDKLFGVTLWQRFRMKPIKVKYRYVKYVLKMKIRKVTIT